ncbi:MAG: hypothetical protein KAS39_08105, partial [Actinomycetia bacterium]|nr:hypothetical protein [Actinomycetes bacterium]
MKASAAGKKSKHEAILKNVSFSPSKLNKVEERRAQIRVLSNFMVIVFLFSTLLFAYYFESLTDFVSFIGSGYWLNMFFGFMVLFFLLLLADKEQTQRILNSHLFKDLSERENKLQTLYVLASAINKSSDFKEILNLMSVLVCVSLSSDACSIYFYKKKGKELKPGSWHSFNNHQYENLLQGSVSFKKKYKHPLIKAFRGYKPFYIKNIASDVEYSEFNSKE